MVRVNEVSGAIVDAAVKVHRILGPGCSSPSTRRRWLLLIPSAPLRLCAKSTNRDYGTVDVTLSRTVS